ncbi:MAG: amidohydrolase family protein [Nitratireductor sp.]|nr:amidohydrolase family protein [Nitratireductor sp.]
MSEISQIKAPIVDAHFHTWRLDHPLTGTAWHAPPSDAPIDEFIRLMDKHGIIFGVVAAASIFGEYNDYVRAAIAAHPRLRATAVLSPKTDIRQMERMKEEGFVGVRLMWAFNETNPDLESGEYRMFLRRVADLGWHVHLVAKPEVYVPAIRILEKSGVRLVIDHMGDMKKRKFVDSPGFREILAAVDRGNTWVKVSCKFRFEPPDEADFFAEKLIRAAGGDRILWGSDWPFAAFEGKVTYDRVLEDYYHLVPDAEMRRRIDETALRFYFT